MGTKKILVIDFDQEFLRFLSQYLRNKGFSVSTAADGSAGLEKWKTENPDLIVTEAMLPKLHGFELCSKITQSATRKIPVIIVTGVYKDTVYKTEALRTFGASAYFEKPLDPADLLVSIRKILNLPAEPGKRGDDLDEAIIESLVSAPMAPGTTGPQLQTDGRPTSKKGKEDLGRDEIENMLQSTLAEFGLKTGKKKASPIPTATKPVSDLEPPTPKAPPAPPPPLPREKKPDVSISAPFPAFGEFLEKKKRPFFPKIFGTVAGVLILTSAIVIFLKPGKSGSPRQEAPPPVTDGTALETAVPPVGGRQAPDPAKTTAEVKKSIKIQSNTEAQKPAVKKPVETPPQAGEDIKPLIPDSDSLLQLQVPKSAETDTARETAADRATAAGDTPAFLGQDLSREVSADPLAAPAAKLKAGELVPLGDVDVQPQVLKTVEPAYPPAALSMRVEGLVTVNVLISETGDILQTAVVQGIKGALGFNKAAEAAVRKWKFSPAKKGGVKVRVWKPITVIFKLKT